MNPADLHTLRRVEGLRRDAAAPGVARLQVTALRCVEQTGALGYLTGEPLAEQGVETALPNLPPLDRPPLDSRAYVLRVGFPAPEIVRLTLAPAGSRVLDDDGTWLGIVTDPHPAPAPATVEDGEDEVVVASQRVRVRVRRRPFEVVVEEAADGPRPRHRAQPGRVLLRTAGRLRQVAGLPVAPPVLASAIRSSGGSSAGAAGGSGSGGAAGGSGAGGGLTLHLELGVDEDVLGFGEQFGRLVKNGQKLVLRVEDAFGTGTGMAYKPVPVWHSSAGYTALLNTGATVTADVGHRRPSVLGLGVADEAIDLYVIAGSTPAARLTALGSLTGRAAVPPLWAFGLWVGRCRYHSRAETEAVGRGLRAHAVPCDVLHLDPDWLVTDRLNCDFVWNERRFGARRAFVAALEALDLRLSVWEVPYLDPASPRHAEAEERGFLVRTGDGSVAAVAGTPTPDGRARALVDFTNPAARAWWQALHEPFLDDGVAVFTTDFGEGLPEGAVLADGTPPNHAHNLYPLQYHGAVSEGIGRHTGRAPLVWGRSGWAGAQRHPAQWGGDAESTVAGMQASLRGGLSLAVSAPGLWSHDVGGFFGPELTPELYVRWAQFGALSPLMRAHGLRPREPWAFGDEALQIVRRWVRLRYELLPYLWQVAHAAAARTWPVLRPLWFAFPDDPQARGRDDVFLLGPDLLVVPVFDDGPGPVCRRFPVPAGSWIDLLTGSVYEGPGTAEDDIPLHRIPVLARAGALLPRVPVDETVRRTDDLVGRPWVLQTVGVADAEADLVGFDGTVTHVRVTGDRVTAHGAQPVSPHAVRLPTGPRPRRSSQR